MIFFFYLENGILGVLIRIASMSRTKGEGWSTANWLRPPTGFVADRPKAALLFWFFGGFGCDVPLFVVVLVID